MPSINDVMHLGCGGQTFMTMSDEVCAEK